MDPLTIILLALAGIVVLLALLRLPGIIVRTRDAVEAIRAATTRRKPGDPDDPPRSS